VQPIECLFERDGLPRQPLPAGLAELFGGDFGLRRPLLYANFVASVDGVVALPVAAESGAVISGHSEPDRFVMGLLRAFADAVLIGAGTFRAGAGDRWWPEAVYPAASGDFAELRARLGLRPHPCLVVVSASGELDPAEVALRDAWVLTTAQGEARLRGRLPTGAHIAVMDAGDGCGTWLGLLHQQGFRSILNEGGPTVFGQLLEQGLVDELFLTTSPVLLGRRPSDGRKSLISGVDLASQDLNLLAVRRHGSHVFLRYAVAKP
jgi:riboflavin biosynthesis pyrimidine reductase